jgi:hypothetical protein
MKRAIMEIGVDFRKGDQFEIQVQDPGIVRATLIVPHLKERNSLIANADEAAAAAQNKPVISLIPTIVFEVDPEGPKRVRKFGLIKHGQMIESEGNVEFKGTFQLPTGELIHLFEELDKNFGVGLFDEEEDEVTQPHGKIPR